VHIFSGKNFSFTCIVLTLLSAQANADGSSSEARWGYGLQLAPLTVGLSIQHAFNERWTGQVVVSPGEADAGINLRALRRAQTTPYWHSYQFASIATTSAYEYNYDYNSGDGDKIRYNVLNLATGMGVSWNWQGNNANRPPLFTSLELGISYQHSTEDDTLYHGKDGLSLMMGAGLHYRFD